MAIPDTYFDNNKQVYTSVQRLDSSVPAGSDENLTFGLADLAELPATAALFVNKIVFKGSGFVNLDATSTGDVTGFWCAGIIPRDLQTDVFDRIADYQDYKAWPLLGCMGWTICQGADNPVNNRFAFSKTWHPRKALILNREQNIMFNWHSENGPDSTVQLQIQAEFKRIL